MAQSPQQKQKKLAQKAAKRKQKASQARQQVAAQPGLGAQLQIASGWPVIESVITQGWELPATLIQILVARQSPSGRVAVALFLVDLACLGVKDAHVAMFDSAAQYSHELREGIVSKQPMIEIDVNLVAKILKTGIEYAAQFDIAPHRDYLAAARLLGQVNPDAVSTEVPVGGPDGKPLFIPGPYDNVDSIVYRLERKLGPEGFEFAPPPGFLPGYDFEDEEFFADEDEEGEDVGDVIDITPRKE